MTWSQALLRSWLTTLAVAVVLVIAYLAITIPAQTIYLHEVVAR